MPKKLNDKELGLIFTPYKTVEYIISRLGEIKDDQLILDPCVGPGIFVEVLLRNGLKKEQIYAFDINPNHKRALNSLGIKFLQQDTLLAIKESDYNNYDFIIGNPPYLNKSSSYIKDNRKELKKIYGKINAHETYSMFIVNSIWRLKEGGKLGFITSDSFLTLSTHKRLRKFILENCLINELLLAPQDLFSNQKVSTSPVIIILTKASKEDDRKNRLNNRIKVVARVENEEDYWSPKKMYEIPQKNYFSLPFNIFYIDIEPQVINLFGSAPKLKNFIKGYIGMHTHNNRKYIAAIEGTDLARIFTKRNSKIIDSNVQYRIISNTQLKRENWKPYFKRGGSEQYYRPIMEALEWNESSKIKYDIPNNVPFEKEGLIISGISSRLAARYMPKGCYWDSNKAIGFIVENSEISIEYALGLLNSSLYNYLAKGIINNTNSIQLSGIHALPFILPDSKTKLMVENYVKEILIQLKQNDNYNYEKEQMKIDDLIFNLYTMKYNFPERLKRNLDKKYSTYKKV